MIRIHDHQKASSFISIYNPSTFNCVEKRAQKIPRIHWDARDCGNKKSPAVRRDTVVEEGGFEPPKRIATDLQSAPFGHSGTPPFKPGAGGRTRTPDLLITNQLLYQLSYTSVLLRTA